MIIPKSVDLVVPKETILCMPVQHQVTGHTIINFQNVVYTTSVLCCVQYLAMKEKKIALKVGLVGLHYFLFVNNS